MLQTISLIAALRYHRVPSLALTSIAPVWICEQATAMSTQRPHAGWTEGRGRHLVLCRLAYAPPLTLHGPEPKAQSPEPVTVAPSCERHRPHLAGVCASLGCPATRARSSLTHEKTCAASKTAACTLYA